MSASGDSATSPVLTSSAAHGGGARELQVLSDLRDELARTWTAISRVGTNVNPLAKATTTPGSARRSRSCVGS